MRNSRSLSILRRLTPVWAIVVALDYVIVITHPNLHGVTLVVAVVGLILGLMLLIAGIASCLILRRVKQVDR